MPPNHAVELRQITNVPLFSMLDEPELEVLARAMRRRRYPRGAIVLMEGAEAETLYVILSGRLKVVKRDEEGREIILAMLGRGEYFGEMALLDDNPRSANVETVETSEVLTINKADFHRLLAENFDLAIFIMRGLVARLRMADNSIGSLALLDVYGRVARLLLEHAQEVDGRMELTESYTRQEIANMVGASREMVGRVMRDFRARGFIAEDGNRVIILDASHLQA